MLCVCVHAHYTLFHSSFWPHILSQQYYVLWFETVVYCAFCFMFLHTLRETLWNKIRTLQDMPTVNYVNADAVTLNSGYQISPCQFYQHFEVF